MDERKGFLFKVGYGLLGSLTLNGILQFLLTKVSGNFLIGTSINIGRVYFILVRTRQNLLDSFYFIFAWEKRNLKFKRPSLQRFHRDSLSPLKEKLIVL